MEKSILTIAILIISFSSGAQHTNLNDTELFDGIKFNNVSLGKIMETGGDLTKMRSLFGDDIQEMQNDTAPYLAKDLYNDKISFGFEDETDTGEDYYLAFIDVLDPSVVVTVKGISISLGDDKTKLGRMIFNSESNLYTFIDQDTGSASLSFKIDSTSNKVTEIRFILF